MASLSSTTITVGRKLCADGAITQPFCVTVMFLLSGYDPVQFNTVSYTIFPF